MSTQLIFIRHARSVWNDVGRWQGHADPPLSQNGQAEARRLAKRLATWPIDQLYCSDLERARMTAAQVGSLIGKTPVADPIWRERGIGVLEGLTSQEIAEHYPELWAGIRKGPMEGVPGAESSETIIGRAAAGCQSLLQKHPGETIAIISHGGMIINTLIYLLNLSPDRFRLLGGVSNTGISQVVIDEEIVRLLRFNDAAHLELLTDS